MRRQTRPKPGVNGPDLRRLCSLNAPQMRLKCEVFGNRQRPKSPLRSPIQIDNFADNSS
jgi:hypothetical protein